MTFCAFIDSISLHAVGFSQIAERWAVWIWPMLWQLSLVVFVLLTLEYVLQSRSARLRYWLWILVLVRMVLPPSLSAPTSLFWWMANGTQLGNIDLLSKPPGLGEQAMEITNQPVIEPRATASSEADTLSAGGAYALSYAEMLFLIWLGVVLTRFVFLALAARRVQQWLATAQPITDSRIAALLEKAKQHVGIARDVDLRDSQACTTPLVTGIWRPTILIPSQTLQTFDEREIEAILVHELIHLRRGDNWIRWCQAVLSILYFFHPVVWIANYFIHQTREDACDEETIRALRGQRKPYAAAIIKAASLVGYQPPHLSLGMLQNTNAVTRRVRRVLDPDLPVRHGRVWLRTSLVVLVALITLPSGIPLDGAVPLQTSNSDSQVQVGNTGDSSSAPSVMPQDPVHQDRLSAPETESQDSVALKDTVAAKAVSEPRETTEQLAAIEALQSPDFMVRRQAYEQLIQIGHRESLDALERAYLQREGVEQQAAKEALDAVWRRIRRDATNVESAVRSPRVLEPRFEEYPQ